MVMARGHVEGIGFVRDQFDELSRKLQRKVLRDTLRSAAQPMHKAAVNAAPVAEGTLRDSIKMRVSVTNRKAEVQIGIDASSDARFYAHIVEFGAVHVQPRPFMRTAFDQNTQAVVDKFGARVGEIVERIAAKAAQQRLR